MPIEDYIKNCLDVIKAEKLTRFNVCTELINYTPISLREIIKSGVLKNISDIHRDCIDYATARKAKKQG